MSPVQWSIGYFSSPTVSEKFRRKFARHFHPLAWEFGFRPSATSHIHDIHTTRRWVLYMIYYTISIPLCLVSKCLFHLFPIRRCITSLNKFSLVFCKIGKDVLYKACSVRVIPLFDLLVTDVDIHSVSLACQRWYSNYFSHNPILSKNVCHCQAHTNYIRAPRKRSNHRGSRDACLCSRNMLPWGVQLCLSCVRWQAPYTY